MTTALDNLARWRADPISFVEHVLINPETGKPFELLPAERAFLAHAFQPDDNGKLLYPEQVYSCPKKSGKTTFAGLHALTLTLLFGGSYPEATCCANDQEQAAGRVFEMIRRIVDASPALRVVARVTADRIMFPALNATFAAIPSNAATAAGGNQCVAVFDELWAYTSERSRRLWDEMVPPPTRKIACRLTVTYAGYEGESLLLEELYKRGLQQPQVGKDLYAGDGLLMFWSHSVVAPWQDERWLAEMRRSQRPSAYQRMVLNEFASSEAAFVDMSAWDQCVVPSLVPTFDRVGVYIGIDASTKRDSTALVAVKIDTKTGIVQLVAHTVFTPTPGDPIDFEQTVEKQLREWGKRYTIAAVFYDPFQLVAVMQRLAWSFIVPAGITEFPQTVPNLTAATSNLYDLLMERRLALYPDAGMRLAASRAVIVESSRGWRLDKLKQAHKIDVIVALSMACLAAVRGQNNYYDIRALADALPDETEKPSPAELYRQQLMEKYGQPCGQYQFPREWIEADKRANGGGS